MRCLKQVAVEQICQRLTPMAAARNVRAHSIDVKKMLKGSLTKIIGLIDSEQM